MSDGGTHDVFVSAGPAKFHADSVEQPTVVVANEMVLVVSAHDEPGCFWIGIDRMRGLDVHAAPRRVTVDRNEWIAHVCCVALKPANS